MCVCVCVCVCVCMCARSWSSEQASQDPGGDPQSGTKQVGGAGGQALIRQTPARATPPLLLRGCLVAGWEAAPLAVLLCSVAMERPVLASPVGLGPLTPVPLTFRVRAGVNLVHSEVTWPPGASFPAVKWA